MLPYEPSSRENAGVRTGLKEFQSLLRALDEAIGWIQVGNLEKFDSLVGENSCQTRAVWMGIASVKFFAQELLIDQIKTSLRKIENLLIPKSIESLMRSKKSLKDVLEKHKLDVFLTHEENFLFHSFLLSEMKTVQMSDNFIPTIYRIEICEPKNFTRFGDVSTSFARNLLSKLRRSLANSSVQFVRENALRSQNQQQQRMVS